MELPANQTMKNTAHGSGDKGMSFYSYEDAAGAGIMLDARRKDGRSPFVETWRFRWLPEREFRTYAELREAVGALSPEQVAAEQANWPKLVKPPRVAEGIGGGKCWLHTDRPRTHIAFVQASWHQYDCITTVLCAECAEAAATDPAVIVRASEARRAYVAARRASEGDPLTRLLKAAAQ